MKIYSFLFILLLFTVLSACRKDKPIPVCVNDETECQDFDWGGFTVSITYFYKKGNQYQTPYFNPNNQNEFVYNYRNYELDESKLMKYNIQTGVKTELANNVKIINQPKWSRKGWIAFDNVYNANYQIWIVKENGDSLTQFTNNIYNIFPIWDAAGDNLYWQHSPVLGIPYYFFKQNLYSSIIDTILKDGDANNGYSGYGEISIDNILLTNTFIGNESHLAYSNVNSISFTSVFNINQVFSTNFIRSLSWSNNSQTAYFTVYNNSDNDGLFKLNVLTNSYTKLMGFCDTKRYENISCSLDGKKLIAERVDSYLESNTEGQPTGKIIENSSIYLIDLETLEETKINLE